MAVSLPYDVIKAIEDAVPQSEQAEKVIRAIEQSLCAIRKEAQDREALVKAQVEEAVKEGLKDELASKEDLALLRAELKEEIAQIKEALKHTATREEMETLKSEIREIRILLKVVIGIILAGFTIFNPGFMQTIKVILGFIH